jgi:hypothetical protein
VTCNKERLSDQSQIGLIEAKQMIPTYAYTIRCGTTFSNRIAAQRPSTNPLHRIPPNRVVLTFLYSVPVGFAVQNNKISDTADAYAFFTIFGSIRLNRIVRMRWAQVLIVSPEILRVGFRRLRTRGERFRKSCANLFIVRKRWGTGLLQMTTYSSSVLFSVQRKDGMAQRNRCSLMAQRR